MTAPVSILGRALAAALRAQCRAGVDGFLARRGLDDAVEATVTFGGRAAGRLVITMPRSLLPPLFGAIVPKLAGAELELLTALGELASATCNHVIRALHESVYGFALEKPHVGPATATENADSEVIVRVGGSWLAANLIDDHACGG